MKRSNQQSQSWSTDDGSYSPDRFYCRSVDKQGHGSEVRAQIPPEMAAVMERIVQQQKIPNYQTKQDIVRDALAHRLHYITTSLIDDPRLRAEVDRYRRMADLLDRVAERERLSNYVEQYDHALAKAVRDRDWLSLVELLNEAYETVDEIRDPYREQLKELHARYTQNLPDGWKEHLR